MTLQRLICRGWSPRRGVRFACYLPGSVIAPGEPGGEVVEDAQCSMCRQQEQAAWDKAARRGDRNARRDRERGKKYGPAPENVDVFEGMRGK